MPKLPNDGADLATVVREFRDALRATWIQLRQMRTEIQNLADQITKDKAEINKLR